MCVCPPPLQVGAGLLWNVHNRSMQLVRRHHGELSSLLMHRNRLAAHLVGVVPSPPPMLHSQHTCSSCFVSSACAVYHKVGVGGGGRGGSGGVGVSHG